MRFQPFDDELLDALTDLAIRPAERSHERGNAGGVAPAPREHVIEDMEFCGSHYLSPPTGTAVVATVPVPTREKEGWPVICPSAGWGARNGIERVAAGLLQ